MTLPSVFSALIVVTITTGRVGAAVTILECLTLWLWWAGSPVQSLNMALSKLTHTHSISKELTELDILAIRRELTLGCTGCWTCSRSGRCSSRSHRCCRRQTLNDTLS